MSEPLSVLLVEDSEDDARLLVRELERGGYAVSSERVDSAPAMEAALERGSWDLILSDYSMPHLSGVRALELWKERGLDIPFIYVSATIGEEIAVAAMKAGAKDYVMKGNLARLAPSVRRELAEVQVRRAQKVAEEAMQLSERRYRQLFAAAQQGILVLNAESGRIVDVNPFLQAMLGYELAELQGKQLWEIESFAGIAGSAAAFAAFAEKHAFLHDALVLKTREGRMRVADFSSSAYLVDAHRVIQCHLHDITERKDAEAERLLQSAALNAAANAIVISDAEGTMLWVNDAFTTLTGFPRAEAIGQNPRLLKSGEHPREFYEEMWKTVLAGRVWRGQMRNRRKDGTLFDEETTITPLQDAAGRITHFIAIKQDITEKLALERQFLRAQRLESIGALASGVAHDLNNILSPDHDVLAAAASPDAAGAPRKSRLYDRDERAAGRGDRAAGAELWARPHRRGVPPLARGAGEGDRKNRGRDLPQGDRDSARNLRRLVAGVRRYHPAPPGAAQSLRQRPRRHARRRHAAARGGKSRARCHPGRDDPRGRAGSLRGL